MEWNKKGIDKPVEKERSVLDTRLRGVVRKFKPVMPLENTRANMFGSVDYEKRRWAHVAILDIERRKAEALTLIRRVSFV